MGDAAVLSRPLQGPKSLEGGGGSISPVGCAHQCWRWFRGGPLLVKHPEPTRSWSQVEISPISVCAGLGSSGEPVVHVVPISSESRNIWGRQAWLAGSDRQQEALWQVVLGQQIPALCTEAGSKHAQNHIKSCLKQQEVGSNGCLAWGGQWVFQGDAHAGLTSKKNGEQSGGEQNICSWEGKEKAVVQQVDILVVKAGWLNQLYVALLEQGLDQVTSGGPFQHQPFCDAVASGS